jgi:Cdc6-like AAA superfamily ATPase
MGLGWGRVLKSYARYQNIQCMTNEQNRKIKIIGEIYTPSYPIEIKELFSGRTEQLRSVFDFLRQKGKHIIVYGDRGVGKTSFANVIKVICESNQQVVKVSCSTEDSFEILFHNVLSKLTYDYEEAQKKIGFGSEIEKTNRSLIFSNLYSPDQLNIQVLTSVLGLINPIIIMDEFDRLNSEIFNKAIFTDLLKNLADNLPNTTLIIVGVSEDVSSLIEQHLSIERNLSQIYMPSMSSNEIRAIITKGERPIELIFDEEVKERIVNLSSGYPHFTHSLCYYSTTSAVLDSSSIVSNLHLNYAIKQTIENAHESLRNSYRTATLATKQNIYQEVLYAASIVETDEYGYFQANDLEDILSSLLSKKLKVNNFTFHLGKFCTEERGEIFIMTGAKNRHRYKFKNPLMRAFIRLKMEQKNLA